MPTYIGFREWVLGPAVTRELGLAPARGSTVVRAFRNARRLPPRKYSAGAAVRPAAISKTGWGGAHV